MFEAFEAQADSLTRVLVCEFCARVSGSVFCVLLPVWRRRPVSYGRNGGVISQTALKLTAFGLVPKGRKMRVEAAFACAPGW